MILFHLIKPVVLDKRDDYRPIIPRARAPCFQKNVEIAVAVEYEMAKRDSSSCRIRYLRVADQKTFNARVVVDRRERSVVRLGER